MKKLDKGKLVAFAMLFYCLTHCNLFLTGYKSLIKSTCCIKIPYGMYIPTYAVKYYYCRFANITIKKKIELL